MSEAIKLVLWLHAQDVTLTGLRQDLIDEWITNGTTTRRTVRMFLFWLDRSDVTAPLHVPWTTAQRGRGPLDDEQRFAVLRRLLHDDSIDLRDRLAGSLLLLYAQPLTRTAALRTSDIHTVETGDTTIVLARGAIPLPDPLAGIATRLRSAGLGASGEDGWLFAGQKAGMHIGADRLQTRLQAYGIRSVPGRQGALLALAARLPAPILAERIGIHQARAAQWVRAAGGTYGDYVALRHQP